MFGRPSLIAHPAAKLFIGYEISAFSAKIVGCRVYRRGCGSERAGGTRDGEEEVGSLDGVRASSCVGVWTGLPETSIK